MDGLRVYKFHPDRLDPVTVFVEQLGECRSRVTVQCYARAWTAYWGSHGECQVEKFIVSCDADYLADNFSWGLNGLMLKRIEKPQRDYLIRVIQSIQQHFKEAA